MQSKDSISRLLAYWTPVSERFGLILRDGSVVELPNVSPTPHLSFMAADSSLDPYRAETEATWHTHPKNNVNLSSADFLAFQRMPAWVHYIVTERRIRSFIVRNNMVMLHEADSL